MRKYRKIKYPDGAFLFKEKGRNFLKTRIEGAYTYYCSSCETVFAVVSRLSVKQDKAQELTCPKCQSKAKLYGEGHITYELCVQRNEGAERVSENVPINALESIRMNQLSEYPDVLTAKDVAEILNISVGHAYEMMRWTEFPTIKLGRVKRVRKDKFIEWMEKAKK
jgi:excisionase family DNA binding protein